MKMTATLIFLVFSGLKDEQGGIVHLNQPVAKTVEFQTMELCMRAKDTYDRLNTAAIKRNEGPGYPIIEVHTECVEIRYDPLSELN